VARAAPRSRTPGLDAAFHGSADAGLEFGVAPWISPNTAIARNPGAAEIIGTNLLHPGQRVRAAPPPRHLALEGEGAPIALKSIGRGGTLAAAMVGISLDRSFIESLISRSVTWRPGTNLPDVVGTSGWVKIIPT
jgi:hypothetical protein